MIITDNVEDVMKAESMVLPRPCRYDDLTRGEGNFTTPPTSRKIVSGSTVSRKDLGVRTTSIKAARRLGDFEGNEDVIVLTFIQKARAPGTLKESQGV